MECGNSIPSIVEKRDELKRFALACGVVNKGFRCKRVELAVFDVCYKGMIPPLCVKFVEPGAELAKIQFGK